MNTFSMLRWKTRNERQTMDSGRRKGTENINRNQSANGNHSRKTAKETERHLCEMFALRIDRETTNYTIFSSTSQRIVQRGRSLGNARGRPENGQHTGHRESRDSKTPSCWFLS